MEICGVNATFLHDVCWGALTLCYPGRYDFGIRFVPHSGRSAASRFRSALSRSIPITYAEGGSQQRCVLDLCERVLGFGHHVAGIGGSDDYVHALSRDSMFIAIVIGKCMGPVGLSEYIINAAKSERRMSRPVDNFLIRRPRRVSEILLLARSHREIEALLSAAVELSVNPPPIAGTIDMYPFLHVIEKSEALPRLPGADWLTKFEPPSSGFR